MLFVRPDMYRGYEFLYITTCEDILIFVSLSDFAFIIFLAWTRILFFPCIPFLDFFKEEGGKVEEDAGKWGVRGRTLKYAD